jgi:chromosome transmission fidelity protein 1
MAEEISFPFQPYPQQRDLMKSIYHCVEASSVGCFESPTGTGKSLSVICATLSWQFQEEKRILKEHEEIPSKDKPDNGDDWLKDFQNSFDNETAASKEKKKAYDHHLAMKDRVQRAFNLNQRQQALNNHPTYPLNKFSDLKKGENVAKIDKQDLEPDDEFALKYYDSDEEQQKNKSRQPVHIEEEEEENSRALSLPKIYYCSRTHSQIQQFVNEIKCTAFASARCVTLGSRRNLCINSEVTSLKSDSKISERCLEKQKGNKKSQAVVESNDNTGPPKRKQKIDGPETKPCEFKNKQKEKLFADHALGKIRDIESLMALGDETKACPYYGTRRALHDAQVTHLDSYYFISFSKSVYSYINSFSFFYSY